MKKQSKIITEDVRSNTGKPVPARPKPAAPPPARGAFMQRDESATPFPISKDGTAYLVPIASVMPLPKPIPGPHPRFIRDDDRALELIDNIKEHVMYGQYPEALTNWLGELCALIGQRIHEHKRIQELAGKAAKS